MKPGRLTVQRAVWMIAVASGRTGIDSRTRGARQVSENDQSTYRGQCFCGAVQFEATGAPFLMGYCHCSDCRAWAAAPVNCFTLWKPDDVVITEGASDLATYKKTEKSHRQFCAKCGGHVLSGHPDGGFTDVYAAVLPTLAFEPAVHVFYGEAVLPIKDGLPKFRDVPEDAGGSGEMVPE